MCMFSLPLPELGCAGHSDGLVRVYEATATRRLVYHGVRVSADVLMAEEGYAATAWA